MINMEEYKDLIDEIRKIDDEEARCEVKASEGPTLVSHQVQKLLKILNI